MLTKRIGYLVALVVAVTAMTLNSCGVSRSASSGRQHATSTSHGRSGKRSGHGSSSTPKHRDPAARMNFAKIDVAPGVESLLREADSWIGTPYLYGGNDRNGVDCSGFVLQVFLKSAGVSLPRTSREQQTYCLPIAKEDMEPGDLVFFSIRGGDQVGHVGIYIGNDQMIHASSSKGVIISSLSSNYYVVNYFGSGRVERFYAMNSNKEHPSRRPGKSDRRKVAKPVAPAAPAPKRVDTPMMATASPQPSVASQSPTTITTATDPVDIDPDLADFFE